MPEISLDQLRTFARQSDTELRLGPEADQLATREGSWGGRLMRNLKIAFGSEDRSSKQVEYAGAKFAVLETLKTLYGEEIGTKAFRAGVGEERDGVWQTSADHPLTGRHIAKMLDQAERLVGGVSAMADWIDNIRSDGAGGTRQVTLGGKISIPSDGQIPIRTAFEQIQNELNNDAQQVLGPDEAHGFWMMDVELESGRRAEVALHIAKDNPNMVEVLQRNGQSARVPKDEIGGWMLNKLAGRDDERIKSLGLYRAEETTLGGRDPKIVAATLTNELRMQYSGFDDNKIPRWHTPEVLTKLEQHVSRFIESSGFDADDLQSVQTAIEEFRAAINTDERLPEGLRAKLSAGLDAMREEELLFRALGETPMFGEDGVSRLSKDKVWTLFNPGPQLGDGKGKWELEQRNQGSLAGMYRQFREMLNGFDEGVELTPKYLEDLHQIGTQNTYTSDLVNNLKDGFLDQLDEDDRLIMMEGVKVRPGYREGDVTLTLRIDSETTRNGRAELQGLKTDTGWFEGVTEDVNSNELGIKFTPIGRGPDGVHPSEKRAQEIFTRYREGIDNAQSQDEKLRVIAKTTQDLYRSHLFQDGNTRTLVFTAMNRMLLENGLPPSFLNVPKAVGGYSVDELVDEMRIGMAGWNPPQHNVQ